MAQQPPQEQSNTQLQASAPRFRLPPLRSSTVPIKGKRRGFLPFETNPWGRIFVSILLTIAIHLLWMRFLEADISLTFATILSLIMTVVIFVRG